MLRKIFKAGNSLVVSIPKDSLNYLGLTDGADVSVDLDRQKHQIIIAPVEAPLKVAGLDENYIRQVAEFIEEYRPALEALARS